MANETLRGIVVDDKQDKTVIVQTEDGTKYSVHDEYNAFANGYSVSFVKTQRPISKTKSYMVLPAEILHGTVVDDRLDKTVIVRTDDGALCPVHDEYNAFRNGVDVSFVAAPRPISSTKRHMVLGAHQI